MVTTLRAPVPSEDTQRFSELFPDPSPIPTSQLELGATYYGYGGNVAPIATLVARDSLGRLAFTGYQISVKTCRAEPITEILYAEDDPLRDPAESVFVPTVLITSSREQQGTDEVDRLVNKHLAYLLGQIAEIEQNAHQLSHSRVYRYEIGSLREQIRLIQSIKVL